MSPNIKVKFKNFMKTKVILDAHWYTFSSLALYVSNMLLYMSLICCLYFSEEGIFLQYDVIFHKIAAVFQKVPFFFCKVVFAT